MSEPQQAEPEPQPESRHITAGDLDLDLGKLPRDEAEAERRFESWSEEDPFPEIEPALLNSADLFDYIATTGMIYPFEIDAMKVDETLKPASCGIRIGGPSAYWAYDPLDGSNKRMPQLREDSLGGDDVLTLPPNSIVYATLAPRFRLPDYIAARFNLSIKYVYRGLLVGTGPLVDPGFTGNLQIPLHNLTSTPCAIATSDAVLWMEFTKLSAHQRWAGASEGRPRNGRYVPFPPRKKRAGLRAYFDHANHGDPIVSSIPEAVEQASAKANEASKASKKAAESAAKAADEAKAARRTTGLIRVASLAAAVLGVITLLGFLYDIQTSIRSDADTALHRSNELEQELNRVKGELKRRARTDAK